MYAPQEACGVVFDVKAIVPCRGFCVLAFDFCPPPEAGAGVSVRSPARAALYRPQLTAYSQALSRVLETPVAEMVLYFFAPGCEVRL